MEFLKLIGTFLIQPLLWLGILWTIVSYSLRIRSDRRNFKIALNKDCFEIRHFIKKGILWGIVGSLVSLIIGCYLPMKVIVLYEILAAVAALCTSRIDLSAVPLYILGILAVLRQSAILPVILLLLGFNYFVKERLTHGANAIWFTPQVKHNRRKRRLAVYRWSEFTILPLMIYIPGTLMEKLFHFLPLLHFGEFHFSLFILPFFVSSAGRIRGEQIETRMQVVQKQNLILAAGAFAFAVVAWLLPHLGILWIMLMLALTVGVHLYHYLQINKNRAQYIEVSEGIRVIAIRPGTPAAKMSLNPGDVILTCNNQPVTNENQFYEALQLDSAYCHLKVKTMSGDLKITEGAIYNDSPYELGIVQFRKLN